MKIMALENYCADVDWKDLSDMLKDEARTAYSLYLQGIIREMYFTENDEAVLILECNNKDEALTLLRQLPLVKNKIIDFDLKELKPYPGLSRILK
jgi:hypothetical protein